MTCAKPCATVIRRVRRKNDSALTADRRAVRLIDYRLGADADLFLGGSLVSLDIIRIPTRALKVLLLGGGVKT